MRTSRMWLPRSLWTSPSYPPYSLVSPRHAHIASMLPIVVCDLLVCALCWFAEGYKEAANVVALRYKKTKAEYEAANQ